MGGGFSLFPVLTTATSQRGRSVENHRVVEIEQETPLPYSSPRDGQVITQAYNVPYHEEHEDLVAVGTEDVLKQSSPHVMEIDPEYKSFVPSTPVGAEADIFKYYCPLCMAYYKFILRSQCCKHYICYSCTCDYLFSKGVTEYDMSAVLQQRLQLERILCPQCCSTGFSPVFVSEREVVRDYHIIHQNSSAHMRYCASPLRIGEGFEDMKRKMLPFRLNATPSSSTKHLGLADRQISNVSEVEGAETPRSFSCQGSLPVPILSLAESLEDDGLVPFPPSPSTPGNCHFSEFLISSTEHTCEMTSSSTLPTHREMKSNRQFAAEIIEGAVYRVVHQRVRSHSVTT